MIGESVIVVILDDCDEIEDGRDEKEDDLDVCILKAESKDIVDECA